MKHLYTLILFILIFSQVQAQTNPTDGLKEISLSGLSADDGYTFHFYSTDGKLNRGFSEVFVALTDKDKNFVENFTVSDFHPIMDMGMSKHSTPIGKVEKVEGKPLYKIWFSFLMYTGQMDGTWALDFNYTIGSKVSQSAIVSAASSTLVTKSTAFEGSTATATETYTGWFKDRHCTGSVTLPLAKSCGIGCGTGNMANCWNSGLGLFIYNATESGTITQAEARSDSHFLLFDAESKELARAFLLSLPSGASGKLSFKVTGYRVENGISTNETESNVPELSATAIHHKLNAFHLLSIEGTVIENQSNSYSGFATNSYKQTLKDLAPSNLRALNHTGGATIKFTPPANAGNTKSNLTGYKVKVYNKAGELQDKFTTTITGTASSTIEVTDFTAGSDYTYTVSALYPSSAVEVESDQSSVIEKTISGIALPVTDYPTNSKWIQSFTVNNVNYYVSIAYPKSLKTGSQTVKAYINKQVEVLQPYPTVDGGYKIEATPFMRSMGHGSDGNTALTWNATDNAYEGTLNLSMDGDWRINLKIYDTTSSTTTLVAGTDIDSQGNGSTHYWDIYLGGTTGITDLSANGISVYPTLSQGEITVVAPSEAKITVINSSGTKLESYQSAGTKTIQLNVPSGLYLIAVENKGKTFVQKVIIRR